MEFFKIGSKMKYIIYGAGGNCCHIKKLLQKEQYPIVAIFDQRAKTIESLDGIPVHKLEEFSCLHQDKVNSIVIVSVKNVFEHIQIVRKLLNAGYQNIIYKPFGILQGEHSEEWDSIDEAYERIVEKHQLSGMSGKLVSCSRMNHLMVFKDECFIEKSSNRIICWIPAELLCNYNAEGPYQLVPMAAFYPLVNFYQYLLNQGGYEWEEIKKDFFLYSIEWTQKVNQEFCDSLKESMLYSRIHVFSEMEKKVDIDKNFFIRNAVPVQRVDSFRFSLAASGRNRISFLVARGFRFIPVSMSCEDYEFWIDSYRFHKFRKHLEKEKVTQLFTTVPHPMMMSYASQTTDYVSLFCLPVVKELYRFLHWTSAECEKDNDKINFCKYQEQKANLKIFSAVLDEGYISRLLCMYGIDCYRWEFDDRQQRISKWIDDLFEIECGCVQNAAPNLTQCQVLILDSRLLLPDISGFAGELIFFLQWGERDFPSIMYERFTKKKLLFQTIWNMEQVSGWMWEKLKGE